MNESRVNSRSRVPLPTFLCRSDHPEWWSLAEVHGCPVGASSWTVQNRKFRYFGDQVPRREAAPSALSSYVLGYPPGLLSEMSELGAASPREIYSQESAKRARIDVSLALLLAQPAVGNTGVRDQAYLLASHRSSRACAEISAAR